MDSYNDKKWDSTLDAALYYRSIGLHPIPIKPNSKEPLISWQKYQKTQPTEQEIREWFGRSPDANVAIITGSASGLLVIDIDAGHASWPPAGRELQSAFIVETQGGGLHAYYRNIKCIRNSTSELGDGIDVRAEGGYVLAPFSTIDDRPYRIKEGSLEEALKTDPPEWLAKELLEIEKKRGRKRAVSVYSGEKIPKGQRNAFLTSLAGSMRRRGMSEDEIFAALLPINESRCNPPLSEREVRAIARSIARYEPEAPQIPDLGLSDSWNAINFVNTSGTKLHYVPANKSWLYWNGRYWEIDKTLFVEKLALNFAQALWGKAGYIADSEDRKKWARHVNNTQSSRGIESLIKLARCVGSVPIALEEFDTDTRSLNTKSGVIHFDLSRIELQLKEHNPESLITGICPVIYDPEARSALWEHFLRAATNNDKELELFIQRCAGYSLVGENPEEIFFFIWGPDASGKSTFIEATKATMGDYAVSINASAFLSQRSSGGPQPEVIKIKGKRIVIASETEPGKKFNTELIKSLSGRDTIPARDLYSKPIEFKFGGKLWVVSNFAPKVPVEDRAFMRRIVVIPFNNSLSEEKRDPDVKTVLTDSDISGAAILNWLIEGYLNYLDIGLAIPDVVRESIKEYKDEVNPITDFIAECCELDPDNKELQVASSELYEAYTEYCQKNNNKYSINKNRFGRCLRECGLEPARSSIEGTRVRSWVGIRLAGSPDTMDAY